MRDLADAHRPDSGARADGWAVAAVLPYIQIARVDHWFKNAFMLLGVVLAVLLPARAGGLAERSCPSALALLATCLVASSNYVLNELLDGPRDRCTR